MPSRYNITYWTQKIPQSIELGWDKVKTARHCDLFSDETFSRANTRGLLESIASRKISGFRSSILSNNDSFEGGLDNIDRIRLAPDMFVIRCRWNGGLSGCHSLNLSRHISIPFNPWLGKQTAISMFWRFSSGFTRNTSLIWGKSRCPSPRRRLASLSPFLKSS